LLSCDARLKRRMSATTSAESSLWLVDAPPSDHAPLATEITADVAVVGGGIAGVTTALRLQQAGASVALLEARDVGSGVTGCTSAKVTALQSTLLSTIVSSHGVESGEVYATASAAAVEDVAHYVAEAGIECDLERRPAVTYAAGPDELEAVAEEFAAATAAGLPVEWSDDDAGLPYPVAGAIWLRDQIGFQPVRYVRGLADAFVRAGGRVFESSRVLSVDSGSRCQVRTEHGGVSAEQVVVATHYPILDRGLYFARLEAQRSYCIAVCVRDTPPRTMAISAGSDSRSLQFAGDIVIVGGEGHSAGASGATGAPFARLEEFAGRHWDIARPLARWSAQDPVPYDHLPMVGPLVPRSSRLWVATGWSKWGLTGGTFAARILTEAVLGRRHEWASRFTPTRLSLRSTPEIARLGSKFSALMALDRVTPAEVSSAAQIPIGEARVVRDGLGKAGAYRDEEGVLHGVSLRCTHLGCLLRFNGAERSWDCPCHGSRFNIDGEVLEGPAVHPLEQRDLKDRPRPWELHEVPRDPDHQQELGTDPPCEDADP
jgi:glycine/D-amino acid oxidase-like deaminating enzyme/nitrite reductase/ring-hydroxylating ferredoxin subunit